jgi:hypothetical protein
MNEVESDNGERTHENHEQNINEGPPEQKNNQHEKESINNEYNN